MIKKQNKHFSSLKFDLKNTAKRYKLEAALEKFQVLKGWEEVVVGFFQDAEGKTKAVDFKNGTLTVACLSRELAYEIRLLTHRLITALNDLLGRFAVRALYVQS